VWEDLVAAVRDPRAAPSKYNIVTTPIRLSDTETVLHRAVADVRDVGGIPAMVVVSSITPDRATREPFKTPTFLLIAIEYLDADFTRKFGAEFEFGNLHWAKGAVSPKFSTLDVRALTGAPVGTLAWTKESPGRQFMRDVALGLWLALGLIGAIAALLLRWGRIKARQLMRSEAEARHAANTDALTGLPNRFATGSLVPPLIEKATANQSTLAVIAIDLDQFKSINEDFGDLAGDEVLVTAAKRLRNVLPHDALLVRQDGDEFKAFVPGINEERLPELLADIGTTLTEPVTIAGGARVFATASIGYALVPRDGTDSDDITRRVELALEHAKSSVNGNVAGFVPEMDLELARRRALESALRTATAAKAIDVVYQPIMDATGRRVVGVEALARWTDPVLGPVPPDVFVPLAEEMGLIGQIGELVLNRALSDGLAWPGITVAVNVSGAQIHHGDVANVVREALVQHRFPPERLEIEVTESVLLADEKRANEQIKELQALNAKVGLDDFGSGYSSLMYLRKFGFDKLKIDRSFIVEIGKSHDSTVILASIIRLGLDLGMVLTAEGIETEEERAWLEAHGCHQLQGYLFSKPLPAGALAAFLAAHAKTAAAG
jgi:diguanylate cyclase (GGDEF)-like protein